MSKKFAVFDIDGTLIRWQLYHVMVDKLAGAGVLGEGAKQKLRDARMAWKKREHEMSFKDYEQTLINLYEQGLQTLKTKAFDEFVLHIIEEYKDQTYVYTRDLLKNLKKHGYFLCIISGSHHELIEQIGKYYGFDDWVGTHYERSKDGFSGNKEIASHDKARILKEMIEKHGLGLKDSVAIGDSASDAVMLELVDHPIAFNPDKLLFEQAKKNGWPVVIERKNMIYELKAKNGTYILG